ncbi:MAG: Crp/Fnr family transcriptional regulator, partial [Bradyrhizobium sp.]|nr:Crp/Fnr family transcriptional regulator [Bradyrhizobium sp.]
MSFERKGPGEMILSAGERPTCCCLVARGFVFRSKAIEDGIFAFHQAGDIPDLQSLFLHVSDHDIYSLEESILGRIPHKALRKLIEQRPTVAAAFWRNTLIDAAIFREWICNLGQRPASVGWL